MYTTRNYWKILSSKDAKIWAPRYSKNVVPVWMMWPTTHTAQQTNAVEQKSRKVYNKTLDWSVSGYGDWVRCPGKTHCTGISTAEVKTYHNCSFWFQTTFLKGEVKNPSSFFY